MGCLGQKNDKSLVPGKLVLKGFLEKEGEQKDMVRWVRSWFMWQFLVRLLLSIWAPGNLVIDHLPSCLNEHQIAHRMERLKGLKTNWLERWNILEASKQVSVPTSHVTYEAAVAAQVRLSIRCPHERRCLGSVVRCARPPSARWKRHSTTPAVATAAGTTGSGFLDAEVENLWVWLETPDECCTPTLDFRSVSSCEYLNPIRN